MTAVLRDGEKGRLVILWDVHARRVGKMAMLTGVLLSSAAAAVARGITTERPLFGASGRHPTRRSGERNSESPRDVRSDHHRGKSPQPGHEA
jgi:hypothetical protein